MNLKYYILSFFIFIILSYIVSYVYFYNLAHDGSAKVITYATVDTLVGFFQSLLVYLGHITIAFSDKSIKNIYGNIAIFFFLPTCIALYITISGYEYNTTITYLFLLVAFICIAFNFIMLIVRKNHK